MSLKIFVVPFSILLSLIIVIGFIKPDIEAVQEKKSLLTTKMTQLKDMGALLDNISALSVSLDEQSESENLLSTYIPQTMDQERAIDMFNYLASQSGVVVSTIAIEDSKIKNQEEVVVDPTLSEEDAMQASLMKPKAKAFSASVKVNGEYAGIREFFHNLAHMNRFHKIQRFSVGAALDNETETASADTLTGTFDSQFDYFPVDHLSTALNVPVFLRGTFDAAALDSLQEWISYSVSPLREPTTGRANPFQ